MQLNIEPTIPITPLGNVGKVKQEYVDLGNQLKAMQIGNNFAVDNHEVAAIRYVARKVDVALASRAIKGTDRTRFWRVEPKEKAAPAAPVIVAE